MPSAYIKVPANSEMGKSSLKKIGNGSSGKICMSYSSWLRRRQYEEVPDELLELPYNATDSRQSLHNGPLLMSHSNGTINGAAGTENGHCENVYYQPPMDTGQSPMIKIDVPTDVSREEPRFPKEKIKTLYSLVILGLNFILTLLSLSLVHERLPDRERYGPLPDIVLDNVSEVSWALDVSEVLIMIQTNSCILLIAFHKHRFIVIRRVCLIISVLYLMRSITIFVTVLPVPSTTYFCSPKMDANATAAVEITKRVLHLMSGFGLSINGKHTYCGDYIYSGHTVMLVMSYLIIVEYSPKKFVLVHWASMVATAVGVAMVLLAHGHYTIDVVIAYFVTTRLFWLYHTMCNNSVLKERSPNNLLSRLWWFRPFRYFEGNIKGPLPRQYDCPIPWRWPLRRSTLTRVPGRES